MGEVAGGETDDLASVDLKVRWQAAEAAPGDGKKRDAVGRWQRLVCQLDRGMSR